MSGPPTDGTTARPEDATLRRGGGGVSADARSRDATTPALSADGTTARPDGEAIRDALQSYDERYDGSGLAARARAGLAELEALLRERDEAQLAYRRGTQHWVGAICHYRNLAIRYGAQPDEMLNSYDRDLAARHVPDDTDGWENELPDVWADLEKAERQRDETVYALRDLISAGSSTGYATQKWLDAVLAARAVLGSLTEDAA